MTLCRRSLIGTAILLLVSWPGLTGLGAADDAKSGPDLKIKWLEGPATAQLEKTAEIKIPGNYRFADGRETQRILKAMGNPISGAEMGLVAPTGETWFVVFEFDKSGYVKDDEKNKLDADAMLKSITKGNELANDERKKMGVAPLKITGWEQPPHYDEETHRLEWAIRAESEGHPIVNYNTRLLGRKGVMEAALVVEPAALQESLVKFKTLLQDYSFQSGESYAEYRPGDKVAKYGLAALITGGAAVIAVKTGLWAAILIFLKKGWKLLVIAFVAVGSWIKKLFSGRRTNNETSDTNG